MQLGSGTFDLLPGITMLGQEGAMSWGLQGMGTLRIGENDEDYTLGKRLDLGVGANLYIRSGALKGHRLAVEFNLPVYQSLDGPQLKTRWSATVGWQKAF